MPRLLCCLMVAAVTTAVWAGERPQLTSPSDGPFFPFVLRWDDGSRGPTSLAEWNERPAGGKGHVVVRDGHFFAGGERLRFWGTNVCFGGCTPEKTVAEGVGRRMAKFGINVVRFHHMDNRAARGILEAGTSGTRRLDPEYLDRLDFFISRLKAHGIYANLNLHVSHTYNEADGIRDADRLPTYGKYVSIFDPTFRRLMKEYAHDLLTHANPYTGKAYVDEPAVAMVEITNENSLLAGWIRGRIDDLPAYYSDELRRLWNEWLRRRYGSTDELRRDWGRGVEPLGDEMLAAGDFSDSPDRHWQCEQHQGAEVSVRYLPSRRDESASVELRPAALSPKKASWHIQFKQAGLAVEQGRIYTVAFRVRADTERPFNVSVMQNREPWSNLGLSRRVTVGTEWEEHCLTFRAAETEAEDARLNFSLGSDIGTVSLAAVSLRPGMTVLEEGESLEERTVQAPSRTASLDTVRQTDYIRFLNDVEMDFFTEMRDYIKEELHCKSPVTGTIGYGLPGIAVQAEMDFVDAHAYWQHPRFPTGPWSRTDWYVPNLAMVDDPEGSTLARLALARVAGKPFTVTEYNHPAPNEFRAECIPLVAAYGALQDWDGIFIFGYHHATGDWEREHISGFFDIDSDPGKMVQMPLGAAIFRRADVSAAREALECRVSRGAACDVTAKAGLSYRAFLEPFVGKAAPVALCHRFRLGFDGGERDVAVSGTVPSSMPPYVSDTGELRWEVEEERGGLATIDTPRTKALVGRLGGRTVELDGLSVGMPETDTNFAALSFTAMDGKALADSGCILVTAVGRAENTGMGWNREHTSVSDRWGTAPTVAEGIAVYVTLRSAREDLLLHPLDDCGQPGAGQTVRTGSGNVVFSLGPEHSTLWYVLAAQ